MPDTTTGHTRYSSTFCYLLAMTYMRDRTQVVACTTLIILELVATALQQASMEIAVTLNMGNALNLWYMSTFA